MMRIPLSFSRGGRQCLRLETVRVAALLAGCVMLAAAAAPSPQVSRLTLPNGLRVVVVHSALAPVVSLVMNYRVGSDEAPEGLPGTAHALEHMMFRGSPGLSADQLANIAASMGGDFNADTQQTVTQYFFTVPNQDLDVALHIEATRMRGILATSDLWEHERGAIEQEVSRDLSNPEYVFYTKLLTAMFHGTPYEHDALGTRPSFDRTTADMLKKFHDQWYAPNNAILVIAGDIDAPKVLATVKELFGGIAAQTLSAKPEVKLEPVTKETLHLTTDLPYGLAVEAFRLPGSDSADFAAAQVLADVLDSQRGSLYALVPEGSALSAGFELSSLPAVSLGYGAGAFPAGADGAALLAKVGKILDDDRSKGVPADLVEAAKRHELASAEFQKNSISGLAMEWSNALAVEGRESPDADIEAIRKVTVADVNRLASRYLDPQQAISAILTPQPSGHPLSSSSFSGAESFASKNSKPVALPEWARNAAERLTIPESTVHPTVTTLANGIKLIVQPENISDTISVAGHIRNNPDLETPKAQDGVGQVLDQLLSYGTVSLDRLAFQKALDDIAADESPGADFSLNVLSGEFERGVALLADNELHPALPDSAFKIVQGELAQAAAGELRSPGYLRRHALDAALLPAGDPSLRHATPETISGLTMANVKDYRTRVFRPDLTTIVVIGKVTPEQARTVVERYFGAWKAAGPKPETLLPPVPPNKPSSSVVPNASRVQDEVTLAETLGLVRANPDYYALNLANQVLGGAFYASRLSRDLRENTGLVYTVSSSLDVGRTRGFYEVAYGCDPENVSKARATVEKDVKDLQATLVPADVLLQAKVLLLQQIPLSESSVSSIAAGFLARTNEDLPLDEPTRAARRYAAMTAQEVQAAFAKWIRPGDLVQITEGPEPK
jgi:zinc protease